MKVAISGGTGLLGKEICKMLLAKGHEVLILSRSSKTSDVEGLRYSAWQPSERKLNEDDLSKVDAIVNLAGAPVAQRWTEANKKAILNSRIDSTATLVDYILKQPNRVQKFVSASAIGIYPNSKDTSTVSTEPGKGFLSDVVVEWEKAAMPAVEKLGGAIIRIGIVLSKDGGALEKMLPVFKMGLGSALGTGQQWQSWIHIKDVAALFVHALENKTLPVMNGVAPKPVKQKEMSQELARAMGKPFWAPAVPAFVLKLVMGDMAEIALNSQKVSSKSAENSGYQFKFREIGPAMNDLFKK
jgi:uncharacterized protein (TIGR01777 family)